MAAAAQLDPSVAVIGPATIQAWTANPPAPPGPGAAPYEIQNYSDYQNWKADQSPSNSTTTGKPLVVVAPQSTNPGFGSSAAADPIASFRAAASAAPAPSATPPAAAGAGDPIAAFRAAATAPAATSPAANSNSAAAASTPAAATDSAAPAAAPAAPVGTPRTTGPIANLAAGGNEAIAHTLGLPVDLTTGAINLATRGVNAVTGSSIPPIQNAVGGSAWLENAMGLLGADPRNVPVQNVGDQFARAAGSGAAAAVLPLGVAGKMEEAASPLVSTIGKTLNAAPAQVVAPVGAVAGATGAAATDLAKSAGVPDTYLPYVNMAGQILGGGLGAGAITLGTMGARGAQSAFDSLAGALPVGKTAPILDASGAPIAGTDGVVIATPRQAARVGAALVSRSGTSASDLADQLPPPGAAPAVPGSQPTVGQITGNGGLLRTERDLTTADKNGVGALFANRRVEQNAAQLKRLQSLSPEDAQAEAAGNYFVARLNAIDESEAAANAAAQAKYDALAAQHGGVAHPADIGSAIAAHVNARYQPALDAADRAIAMANNAVKKAVENAGGERASIEGETARQAYGAELRDTLKTIRDEANKERAALYAARDPEGKLAIDAGPIKRAAEGLRAELKPEAGDKLTGREEDLIHIGESLSDVTPMRTVAAFRKNVNAALTEANNARNVGTPGAAEAVRRLTILKHSVDNAEAEATERAARSDVEEITKGAEPEKTVAGRLAQHVAEKDGSPATGTSVFTPSGRKIDVKYKVVEAGSLRGSHTTDMSVNKDFPAELQPRDRTRAASEAQVQRMAGNLQPERLGASASAMDGAPIVGPDGVVESGNARYLALRRAYLDHPNSAEKYRQFLQSQGYDVAGMKEPVLVRKRTTPLSEQDRIKFTQEANASSGLSMSAGERAKVDAQRMPASMFEQWRSGDVDSASNRDFVRSFVKHVAEKGEEGNFITADGGISLEGAQRIRNALLQRAYGDSDLVAALTEAGDENIKAFGGALTDAAGDFAQLRERIASGEVSAAQDITPSLLDAAKIISQARLRKVSIKDFTNQRDAFSAPINPITESILQAAYGMNLTGRMSRQKMADLLAFYADEAGKQTTTARLFGENLTPGQILEQGQARAGNQSIRSGRSVSAGGYGAGHGSSGLEERGPSDGQAGQGDAEASKPSTPLTENLTAEDAARFKAADAFNREYQQRFGPKTAAGEVLATGPGGDFKMALSKVAANFWKRGPAGAESTQQLVESMGSPEAAEKAIGDYAAFDLRAYAEREGGLDSAKLKTWLEGHQDALAQFPGLKQQFGTVKRAQDMLDALAARRAEIAAMSPVKEGQTGADTLAQFIKPGPKGGEAIDAYMKHSGATAEARAALADGLAYNLRAEAMKDGQLTSKGYDAWRAKYASALDRVPEVKAQFDTLADARRAVEDTAARGAQARADYLKSVARHYITKGGEPIEPQEAVASILKSPTGPADAAELVRQMKGDPEALKGLQASFADWLSDHMTNAGESGASGVSEVSNAKLQSLIKNDRQMGVLKAVFGEARVKQIVEAVADDVRLRERSVNATKIPGSPGTAADLNATHVHDPEADIAGTAGAEIVGEAIGHMAGLGPLMRILVRGGAIAGKTYFSAAKIAGIQTERDLMAQALLHPDLFRALLAAARQPVVRPSVIDRLNGLIANLAVSGATAAPVHRFAGQKQ